MDSTLDYIRCVEILEYRGRWPNLTSSSNNVVKNYILVIDISISSTTSRCFCVLDDILLCNVITASIAAFKVEELSLLLSSFSVM